MVVGTHAVAGTLQAPQALGEEPPRQLAVPSEQGPQLCLWPATQTQPSLGVPLQLSSLLRLAHESALLGTTSPAQVDHEVCIELLGLLMQVRMPAMQGPFPTVPSGPS
jgi:hypothetical protein